MTFLEKLYCPYGKRCLFKHEDRTLDDVTTFFYMYKMFIHSDCLVEEMLTEDESKEPKSSNRRLQIFQQITSNMARSENVYETPVKPALYHFTSPKLSNMPSIKTDFHSSIGGEDLNMSDVEDNAEAENFSFFLEELCGPFSH